MKTCFRWVPLISPLLSLSFTLPLAAQVKGYFPTTEWRTSTPEKQGMDSAQLAEFIQTYSQPYLNMDSLLVIRHGYIVAEAYSAPNLADIPHHLYSASKSVMSLLIGIAIDQGKIKSVDEKVVSFFPEYKPANMDDRKAAITIKDLLTMGAGFKCDFFGDDPSTDSAEAINASTSASHSCLDMLMAYKPGEKQQYCQCCTYLLSSILTRTTGMGGLEFAQKNLFDPLGITEAAWLTSPEGPVQGFAGLQLKATDMAKIGYLVLRKGEWDGKQIVSAKYVADSTSSQIATIWPDTAYGYQWWINQSLNMPEAIGLGGQYIFVDPARDLVIVLTGGFHDMLRIMTQNFPFTTAVGKFETSDKALPANDTGMKQLKAVIDVLANPQAQSVAALPAITKTLTDQTFGMIAPLVLPGFGDVNGPMFQQVGLNFGANNQAVLRLIPVEGQPKDIAIGLDGLYRVSDGFGGKYAAKGQWLTESDFRVYLKYVGDALSERLDFSFMPGAMTVVTYEFSTGTSAAFAGTAIPLE